MHVNRRRFFSGLLKISGVALAGRYFPETAFAAAPELIDMSGKKRKDALNEQAVKIAKGLNYVADVDEALKAGKIKVIEKKNAQGKSFGPKDQNCANCQFYTPKGAGGTCMLILNGQILVHENGWCNSWTPKA